MLGPARSGPGQHGLRRAFPAPLGLAAGFDKDGLGAAHLGRAGFRLRRGRAPSPPRPQPGNPAPRMFRLPDDRALLNRMGFNNHGAAALAVPLARRQPERADRRQHRQDQGDAARARPSTTTPTSARLRRAAGDLPGGQRQLAEHAGAARPAGGRVAAAHPGGGAQPRRPRPVLVKIAPDLSDSDIDDIADLAVELGPGRHRRHQHHGVARRPGSPPASTRSAPAASPGRRWHAAPLEVLRRLYRRVGDRLVLISVGGIETADDAWERITAGASLLQGYTGFVYGGGLWAKTSTTASPAACTTTVFAASPMRSAQPPGDSALVLVGAGDQRAGDRVAEQVEAQVGRGRARRARRASRRRRRARRRCSGAARALAAARRR